MNHRALAILIGVMTAGHAAAADEGLVFDAGAVGLPNSGAPIELWQPAGAGPFPAIVVLHGCNGVGEGSRGWAARLAGWGYVVAVVDSLGPRKFKDICDIGWLVPPELRAQDAFNAAAYLRSRPEIIPDRIGIIGFSHGASSTLAAALASDTSFRAAVAYYPYCPTASEQRRFASDTLILIGQDDDWNPAERCTKLVAATAGQPHAPTLKVYPGAVHGFDVAGLNRFSTSGHLMRENPDAAADSFATTEAFFAPRLKAK